MRQIQTHNPSEESFSVGSCKESKSLRRSTFERRAMDEATVVYWERKYLESRTRDELAENVPGFIPVQVQPEPDKKKESKSEDLHIIFPNGIQIICPESVHPAILKLLIKSLPCLP